MVAGPLMLVLDCGLEGIMWGEWRSVSPNDDLSDVGAVLSGV